MGSQSLSLLSGEEIKSNLLVTDADDKFFRASTYDLTVGDIVPAGGDTCDKESYPLQPGGMVRVVSKESLKLPSSITAHVLLKNELCTKGVLAINIGVADPGFEGPLSSTLINFGRETCSVEKGTPFLRVSFHRCPVSPKASLAQKYSRDEYLKRVRQEVLAYSAPTFLNMDAMAARAAEKTFAKFKEGIVVWATLIAVIIAVLAIFAPLGASLVDRYVTSLTQERDRQLEQTVEQKVLENYEGRFKALSEQIQQVQRANQNGKK